MKYNFDEVVDRRGTYCMKYDVLKQFVPTANEDTIPLLVADMDFKSPQPVIDAMHKVADHGMFGYTLDSAEPKYAEAVCHWFEKHYHWHFKPEDVIYSNGTIEALNNAIRTFTNIGDGIILSRPVYGHFTQAIEDECFRKVVDSHLIQDENGRYQMDFADIEAKCADPKNTMFILCSPHNPIGRVWTPDELQKLAAICKKHNVLLISDEVHCDIRRKGIQHYPLASVVEDQSNIITLTAINKTFNLAGLQCSNVIILDSYLKARFKNTFGMRMPTPFAIGALIAAYTEGEEWLEQVNDYIDGNIEFVLGFLQEHLPWVKSYCPEGTYTMWLDFSASGLSDQEIHKRIYEDANVILQDGIVHDPEFGLCKQRVCVPAARSVLESALKRIEKVFSDISVEK